MDILQRATQLLAPFIGEDRRNTWLTLAFHAQHRDLYDAIPQSGATADFTVRCVSRLLDRGCLGSRHALSVLLDAVRSQAGDDKQEAFQALIEELDRRRCGAARATSEAPLPPSKPAGVERQSLPVARLVALRAHDGRFVSADRNLGGRLVANRTHIQEWEKFFLYDIGEGLVRLQALNWKFVAAESGGGRELVANRDAPHSWETFRLVQRGAARVALQAKESGLFVSMDTNRGGQLLANRTEVQDSEEFEILGANASEG